MKTFFEEGLTEDQELMHIEWCKRRMLQATERIAKYTSRLDDVSLTKEQRTQLNEAIVEWRLEYNRCYSQVPSTK